MYNSYGNFIQKSDKTISTKNFENHVLVNRNCETTIKNGYGMSLHLKYPNQRSLFTTRLQHVCLTNIQTFFLQAANTYHH